MKNTIVQNLIACPDGTFADPAFGCAKAPASLVSPESSILDTLLKFAGFLTYLAIAVATGAFIYGAILYSTALGDETKIEKAKRTLLWAGIGLVIALLARYGVGFIIGMIA